MKALGIIAEYNPFHEGHRYLIEEARRGTGADRVISVMSGDFTQRGCPAVCDKWIRAEKAVRGGVDLVLELPVCYASNSAEYFAEGGVSILEGTGLPDILAFGSESGDLAQLEETAFLLGDRREELRLLIQEEMKRGMSYPRARAEALRRSGLEGPAAVLREPNNILAVEYIRQLKTLRPFTVKREGAGYNESASRIRAEIKKNDPKKFLSAEKNYYELISARVLQMTEKELEQIFSSGEGLGNKLKREIRYAKSVEDLIDRVKSKAYTRTRVMRLLLHTLLGITRDFMRGSRPYIRVLAFDAKGEELLREIRRRKCAALPVLTNINREAENFPEIEATLKKDILASDLYNLIMEKDLYENSDYVKKPFIL